MVSRDRRLVARARGDESGRDGAPKAGDAAHAKGELERRMVVDDYKESVHQAPFSARMCLGDAFRRCRSFRKLVASFGRLMNHMWQLPPKWPPPHWIGGGRE